MSETEGLFRLSLLAAASGNAKLCQSPFCCLASLLSSRDSKDSSFGSSLAPLFSQFSMPRQYQQQQEKFCIA